MASTIKPKAIRADMRAQVDAGLDGFTRFLTAAQKDRDSKMTTLYAFTGGHVLGGHFKRLGNHTLALMLDAAVEADVADLPIGGGAIPVDIGADVTAGGDSSQNWGHDGDGLYSLHAGVYVLAYPAGSPIDIAQALHALVTAGLQTHRLDAGDVDLVR